MNVEEVILEESVRKWVLLSFFLLLGSASSAATGDWALYTSVAKINDILAGERCIWAATDGGVVRFCPEENSCSIYTKLDGLTGNRVLCIASDSQGNLWFGTDGDGLTRFTPGRGFTRLKHFIGYRVNSLCFQNDSTLYVATDVGISIFLTEKDEIKETYHQFGIFPRDTEVFCVKVVGTDLWAGTATGAARAPIFQPSGVRSNLQDPNSWSSILFGKEVYSIIQADSVVYIGTQKGAYSYENNRLTFLRLPLPFHDLLIHQEMLTAATSTCGVFQAPLSHPSAWTRKPSLPEETASLAVSADSALWAGVQGGHLVRVKSGEVDSFLVNSPAANTFMDLTFDHQGLLWAASSYRDQTGCRGAYCFDGDRWTNYFAAPSPSGNWTAENNVVCVAVDSRRRVWLGTWGAGIHMFSEQGEWKLIDQNNSILKGIPADPDYLVINDICEDKDGNIWMSDFLQGVAVFSDFPPTKQMLYTPSEDGLPSGEEGQFKGSVIAIDKAGLKWIGTLDAGFCLFDDGGTPFQRGDDTVIPFSTSSCPEEMSSNHITDISFDRKDVLWVATDSGVNAIRGQYNPITKSYTCESWDTYLREITVNRILVDLQNNKWFGTENGLYRLSGANASWTHYTQETCGLVDNQVKSLAFDTLTGDIWIGTLFGLNRLKIPGPSVQQMPIAYPNLFISGIGEDEVTFSELSPNSTVRIFTLLGELIRTLTADELGKATWDGTNSSDNLVASGIYFYCLQDKNGNQMLGKLAVLRKE